MFSADRGVKVTWGRIVLNTLEAKQAGYRTVRALNRYDCFGRNFTTMKRIYMDDDDNIVREESVPDPQPVTVRNNSVDEQIWRKVCGLSSQPAVASDRSKGGLDNAGRANANAMRQVSKLADLASSVAARAVETDAPKAVLLSASGVAQNAAPLKTAADEPMPELAPPVPPAPIALPSVKPIPMPVAPQNPVAPVVPKQPEIPALLPSQKPPPPARRSLPASSPLILPAPAPESAARVAPAKAPRRMPVKRASAANSAPPKPSPLLPDSGKDWSYEGATGPDFWGKLRPEWKLCSEGKRQSPLNLEEARPIAANLDPVKFDYRPAGFVITNGSRQLRVKVAEGMGMEVRGQSYALEGFTLHRPAETRIGEQSADMEAHFFHRGDRGQIAVLAVQFVRGISSNAPLQTLLNNLPLERGDSHTPQATLDMAAFLPDSPAHYLYMGSLTAPPCTEGVLWVVMKEPLTISDEQAEIFSRLHTENARPPQPANGRLILESR
jgi:carbonic anhydrase